ncbi:uncharacterized protein PgNI_08502 [Pyricularia grisea]|uniref:FAD dependent oxidoreductase domain-containing protein n=1 Tax=Pyricularia grisea TaxID=148305 RepID=A0A6P8AWR7_PYRGI|nr:uncharacterized protein PgNI_08502 [Pyricularia grisea]TLD06645.1 hypothetical protein PgNI_08502 [Pyricularia grisea]
MSPAEKKSMLSAIICSSRPEPAGHCKEEQRCTSGLPTAEPSISPWLLEPSSKLMGFRSTEDLPEHADIVIVGSGITGAFAAHFLKEGWAKDLSVVMLDAREACWGSSGQNIGSIDTLIFDNAWDVSAMSLESIQLLRDFVRDNEIPCEWQDCLGVYVTQQPVIGYSSASVADIKTAMPDSLGQVIDAVTWDRSVTSSPPIRVDRDPMATGGGWDVEKIRETLAGLGMQDSDGVVLQANTATVHPYRLVAWILERLLERHEADRFALHTHTPVTRLSQRDGGGVAADGSDQRNWTLATPRGEISAGRVLLATNGYTSALLPDLEDLIIPVRCQAAAAAQTGGVSLKKGPVDLENRIYTFLCEDGKRAERLVQRGGSGGQLIVAGGRHVAADFGVGHCRDDVTEPMVERHLENILRGFMDGERMNETESRADLPEVRHWAGIEGYARDYNPWVGAVPESLGGGPGLFLCAGYTLHGLAMAPLCAKRVVQDMMMTNTGGDRDDVDGDDELIHERALQERPATQDMLQIPSKLVSTSGRVEIAMEDWPDVQTMEEEGLETYIRAAVGQIMKGRNTVPGDLRIPGGLRRFEGRGATGRRW